VRFHGLSWFSNRRRISLSATTLEVQSSLGLKVYLCDVIDHGVLDALDLAIQGTVTQ